MPARALANLPVTARLEAITGHSALGAVALWLGVLVGDWPELTAYGRLCAEAQTVLGHCPLCAPAAVLSAAAFAGAVSLWVRNSGRA